MGSRDSDLDDDLTEEDTLAVNRLVFEIHSYNCFFALRRVIDLRQLSTHLLNAEYNPRQPVARLRFMEPQCCISVSRGGGCTIFGCTTMEAAHLAAAIFLKLLKTIGISVPNCSALSMLSLSCTTDLGFCVQLDRAQLKLSGSVYEPEIMPSLRYNARDGKGKEVGCSVFANGRITIVGATSIDSARNAVREAYGVLRRHALPYSHVRN
ncbi:TATA-binding protein-like factor [Giardia muris]|uniref:TATA-binding protein-like factor n=1 Tax=Giardia muris TaxID=5742 RepID=A0A4Z1T065_GIAMU|nr:TATA-binding protein-like factor [Giardia muris]|eukprot:TNJ30375.1 TATA-binding protein-like factor [Giardia muris]